MLFFIIAQVLSVKPPAISPRWGSLCWPSQVYRAGAGTASGAAEWGGGDRGHYPVCSSVTGTVPPREPHTDPRSPAETCAAQLHGQDPSRKFGRKSASVEQSPVTRKAFTEQDTSR